MAERKGLNKYHPADFDPKKIPRIRKPKNHQKKIRFMLPVRARCNKCGNYMSEGTKFNSREEQVTEETYLGIKIYRFYFKCTNCSTELTIKTDPKNCGYSGDGSGATFLYNGHEEEDTKKKHRENVLESLEKRTMVSKRGLKLWLRSMSSSL
ncbi:hypothetical protein Bca52824_027647 [Brassica carinata]|uniref:Splicing factor YJU2 n=1 Tax=Brassica carinata TaxID=52824 RepID=A0A8X8ALG3_BRACI|nr:hypothetical protein Bca52824_027647 [Brassica carinata]